MKTLTETEAPEKFIPHSTWVPLSSVLEVLNDPRWSWHRNSPCKYVELRIDTRTMYCIIHNRDGNQITLKELSRQMDTFLSEMSNT